MADESLGELGRRLDRHEAAMLEALREIRAQYAGILAATVDARVYATEAAARERDLAQMRAEQAKLDGRLTWAFRTAVGGVLFPIIVAVVLLALTANSAP